MALFGRKPVNVCLVAADLPGGPWAQLDERVLPMGAGPDPTPEALRARAAGHRASWRSFVHQDGRTSVWLQVLPLFDNADVYSVRSALADAPTSANRRAEVTPAGPPTAVTPPDVDGTQWMDAVEQALRAPEGPARNLMLRAAVGHHVVIGCLGGEAASVTWSLLGAMVQEQVDRLGRT